MNNIFGKNKTVEEILAWLHKYTASTANLHGSICYDASNFQPGDAFFAYSNQRRQFIPQAISRGVSAVLYEPDGIDILDTDICLAVPNLRELAGEIASNWYGKPSEKMLVIAVTGTNGKTSITQWIAKVLTEVGRPCGIIGTLGSGFVGKLKSTGYTTPDAPQLQRRLAELYNSGAQAVSIEATSLGLDQGRLNSTKIDIAVFTNLTQDHLDYHGTMEDYEAAKTKLFDWPGLRAAVINRDDAMGKRLLAKLFGRVRTIAYGIGECSDVEADLHLTAVDIEATLNGTKFKLVYPYGEVELDIRVIGIYNVSNLLAVLGTLIAANVPFESAIAEVCKLSPITGRMQMLSDKPLVVIDYAHTPDALKKALDALKAITKSRNGSLICIP